MRKFLKLFARWGDSRTWIQTAGWIAWLGALAWGAHEGKPRFAAFGFLLLLGCMGLSMRSYKKTHTFILIGTLLFSPVRFSQAQPPPKPKWVEQCNAVVIGALVIGVGIYIFWKLSQFCKKHLPPPTTPPPPPPPPDTNAPPATNSPPPFPAVELHLSGMPEGWDISTNGWIDNTVSTNPVVFQDFITMSLSSSSDLVTWTNCCTVNLWLSSNSMEGVIYDWNGQPIGTNYSRGNPYTETLTNRLPFPVDAKANPHQFYRDY